MARYCLPDSFSSQGYSPETLSRVTLATLGTDFQSDHYCKDITLTAHMWK